ncbi:MAG TPA: hypothetical protein VEC36_01900 [Patescibacteria group bacterium]|nr:hypothetical protein [Patescibacteria group bacterium]
MKTRLLVLCFLTAFPLFGQGMNNNYPFDSLDVKNSFELLGIRSFKFPLKSNSDGVKLNYIVEQYENGKLKQEINLYKSVLEKFPANLPKSYAQNAFPALEQNENFVRVYIFDRAENEVLLQPKYDNISFTMNFDIDTTKFKNYQYRAMDCKTSELTGKTPLLVRYSNEKGKQLMSCPGDAKIEDIVKMYGSVIIFYADAIKD